MLCNLVMNTNLTNLFSFLRKNAFNRIMVKEALERQTATIPGPVKPGSKGSVMSLVYLNCNSAGRGEVCGRRVCCLIW